MAVAKAVTADAAAEADHQDDNEKDDQDRRHHGTLPQTGSGRVVRLAAGERKAHSIVETRAGRSTRRHCERTSLTLLAMDGDTASTSSPRRSASPSAAWHRARCAAIPT